MGQHRLLPARGKSILLGTLFPLTLLLVLLAFSVINVFPADEGSWKRVDEGLYTADFQLNTKTDNATAVITAVKIDPRFYSLKLLTAAEYNRSKRTVAEWCRQFNLLGAVNAGMFAEDGVTSVGFMKNYERVINPRVGRDNAVLAFNRVDQSVPEVQIIDRQCQDFAALRKKYSSLLQSIRMIDCERRNVWAQQPGKWSTLAIAMDENGNILFLISRTALSVHDFVELVLSLPLGVKNAMYLEGGPLASLYLSAGETTVERYGSWETGLSEGGVIDIALPVPNVIGFVKKTGSQG